MFTKWNNDIMTKAARPPLDLGKALTRNRITTWSGLNEILGFKALVSGEGSLPTRQSGEGPSSADEGTSREADG